MTSMAIIFLAVVWGLIFTTIFVSLRKLTKKN